MTIYGAGASAINQINLVRLVTSRELGKTARELATDKVEERADEARAKANDRIEKMESELAAMESRSTSFGIGAVWGAVVSFANTIAMAVASPIAAPLIGGQLLAGLCAVPAAAAGATIAGMTLGGITTGLAEPIACAHTHDALDATKRVSAAELAITLADREIAEAKNVVETERKASRRVRKSVRDGMSEERKTRSIVGHNLSGRETSPQLVAAGAAGVVAAQNMTLELSLAEEISVTREERQATQEQLVLAVAAHQKRVAAAEEEASNATWRAVFAVARSIAEVAANVVTVGGYSAVGAAVTVASRAANLGDKLITDEDARRMNREAEALDLQSKAAKDRAGDARDRKKSIGTARERSLDASKEMHKVYEQGGSGMVVGALANMSIIQKIRAQAAILDEDTARKDEHAERAGEMTEGRAALEEHKKADEELAAKEDRAKVFAGIQLGLSIAGAGAAFGNEAGMVSKASLDETKSVVGLFGNLTTGAETLSGAILDGGERTHMRSAEEHDLKKKEAQNRASDAEDSQEEARDRQRRALDAALNMQRNLAPPLA